MVDIEKLEELQERIAKQADTAKTVDASKIRKICAFDCAFFQDKAVCGAVVFDTQTNRIIEKKYSVAKAPMPYIPGFLAFREGPLILQTYYSIENEPDAIMIDGHGIAHEKKCGLATYVGIELAKPTIGIARNLLIGEIKDDKIFIAEEERGAVLQTKSHANPLFVSPGNLINTQSAIEITRQLIMLPHKLPEPLHEAHKLAKKTAIKLNGGENIQEEEYTPTEQERIEKEYGVNSGMIV